MSAAAMGGNTVMMCSSRQGRKVAAIGHSAESEADETILNGGGVTEPSGVCFDQLLMRAAAEQRLLGRKSRRGSPEAD